MGKAIAKRATTKGTDKQLSALAAKAERLHHQTYRWAAGAIYNAMRCGDVLIKAKGKLKHGEWEAWAQTNLTFGIRQAQKYMKLAENRVAVEAAKYEPGAYLPINEALALLAKPKDISPEPEEEEVEEAEEDEEGYHAILFQPIGMKSIRAEVQDTSRSGEDCGGMAGAQRQPGTQT